VDAVTGDRVSSYQYAKAKPAPPTKYLLIALALVLVLSLLYAPTSGYDLAVVAGTAVLIAGVMGGIFFKRYITDRLIDKACRALWGM